MAHAADSMWKAASGQTDPEKGVATKAAAGAAPLSEVASADVAKNPYNEAPRPSAAKGDGAGKGIEVIPKKHIITNKNGDVSLAPDVLKELEKHETADWVMVNSSSHRADYMVFSRQCQPKKKRTSPVPEELVQKIKDSKFDLFQVWYNSNKDWGQIQGHYKRARIREIRSKMKYGFRHRAQLIEMYGGGEAGTTRAEKVMADKVARGWVQWHPDFPGRGGGERTRRGRRGTRRRRNASDRKWRGPSSY